MWILYDFIGDCSGGWLTADGGAALANSGQTIGCHNGCPTTGPQVHVLAQTGGDPSVRWPDPRGTHSQSWPMVSKKSADMFLVEDTLL